MTPLERKREIEAGRDVDRLPCVPFMGELKCKYSGVSVWDFSHNPEKMAEAELKVFQMFGYDRIVIGPNTRGISEALGAEFGYPEQGVPFAERAMIESWDILNSMEPVRAKQNDRMKIFEVEADMLMDSLGDIVPLEMSIGGPFTIASILRGIELLLRDCRKEQESVHSLLRMITDSQKSCIDLAAEYGYGIAMADPVANPALIGPRMYKGMEITTGGQRIHDYKALREKIAVRGMEEEGLEHYLDAFKHGMPPHGGLGIGLERLTMKLVGEDNVRETTLFPRDLSRLEP